MPKVSVLLPAYNGEHFIREAIVSTLMQTFTDFELIIVDDGSTDATSAILAEYERVDGRIRVHTQEHQGLIPSLNKACSLAAGEYIARMDADDVNLPQRFAKQVAFLEAHPEVGVLGCWVQVIDGDGRKVRILRFPAEHGVIRFRLCFYNSLTFAHPAVMMRRELVNRVSGYSIDIAHPEDYELWRRLSGLTRLSNLREVLLLLRKHEANYTVIPQNIIEQIKNGLKVSQMMVSEVLGEGVPIEMIELLSTRPDKTFDDLKRAIGLVYRIHRAFVKDSTFSASEKRWISVHAAKDIAYLLGRAIKGKLRHMVG